ncbi:peptide ABC transporter substrate-binding protein [Coraliomargarita sinensis]|uniref:Peptide ABC transporter substrate-binding protein n=1 Tax=Coraliomargarita sinensis TaxID=2174842 RepID=A0A317ZG40_9BACT|nr:peptide ABC transporter substrate-binding protein [Coraliomargarita sinensis]PXA03852.1 peptide ABC transporter substrate-binding protein [Coraliomargarita sinensis]
MRIRLTALLCALCVFCGCDSRQTNVERGNAEKELYFGIGTEPAGLDPHLITGLTELHVTVALFEGLATLNSETMAIEPGVAKSWDISEDGTTYTFHFDPEARWSNGEPVTAQDFLYSFERILSPALGAPYAYMLYDMVNAEAFHRGELSEFDKVGARAPDPKTLIIELNQPTPYFLSLLTHYTWWPVHPPTIEKHGGMTERISAWTKPENFVGNGPFTLESWRINSSIYAKKNPLYRDPDSVWLLGIHFLPVQVDAEERAFRAGHLHLTSTVLPHRIDWYRKNMPERMRFDTALGVYYYMLNTAREPLDDPRVRKALAYSINRELITEHVLKAGQKPAYHFTPPNTGGGYTAETRLPYDPDLARKLLAEAGYPDGEGFPTFEILYNTSESHRSIAVTIQQMWKQELGIDVKLYNQEWKVYLSTRETGNFDILRAAWFGDYDDPNTFLSLGETDNGNNHTNWSNQEYDELIEQAAVEQNPEKRFGIFQKAEAILMEEMPVIPIYFYVTSRLIHPSVQGWHANILDYHPYQSVRLIED